MRLVYMLAGRPDLLGLVWMGRPEATRVPAGNPTSTLLLPRTGVGRMSLR
jgi:hypothetical protein